MGTRGTASLDLYNSHRMEVYRNDGRFKELYPFYLMREHGEIFLDYVRHAEQGRPLQAANALDGVRAVELALAAYESLSTGAVAEVKRSACPQVQDISGYG